MGLVCRGDISQGWWVCPVKCVSQGWVCPGVCTHPPRHRTWAGGEYPPVGSDLAPEIPTNTPIRKDLGPFPQEQTHACENITIPQLLSRIVNIPGSANVFDIPNKEIALSYFDTMVMGFLFSASNLLLVNRYISSENNTMSFSLHIWAIWSNVSSLGTEPDNKYRSGLR